MMPPWMQQGQGQAPGGGMMGGMMGMMGMMGAPPVEQQGEPGKQPVRPCHHPQPSIMYDCALRRLRPPPTAADVGAQDPAAMQGHMQQWMQMQQAMMQQMGGMMGGSMMGMPGMMPGMTGWHGMMAPGGRQPPKLRPTPPARPRRSTPRRAAPSPLPRRHARHDGCASGRDARHDGGGGWRHPTSCRRLDAAQRRPARGKRRLVPRV